MKASQVRKQYSTAQIRAAWQSGADKVRPAGFCSYVIEAIEDDRSDLRLCWCCGARGYQEIAHIVPYSLGGKCVPQNLFLLCKECHTSSPDFIDPKPFINYVNENAGRHSKAMAEVIEIALQKVKDLWEQDPDKAEKLFNNAPTNLDTAFDKASRMASQHGASISTATKVAVYDHAIASVYQG